MRATTSTARLFAALSVSALVVSACGASDAAEPAVGEPVDAVADPLAPAEADAPDPVSDEPMATEPVPVVTEPEIAPEAEAPAEPEPAAPGIVDGGECLIGEWVITEDEMNGYYDTLASSLSEGVPVEFDIEGQTLLTLTATEYTYVANFDLTLDAAGAAGTGVSSGTVWGTWEAIDGRIVTTLGSSDLAVSVTVGDITIDGSDLTNGLLGSSPINDAPFDCDGLTIGFQAEATGEVRHDVALTPA